MEMKDILMKEETKQYTAKDILLFLYIVCLPLNHISLPGIGAAYQVVMLLMILYFGIQLFAGYGGKLYFDGVTSVWLLLTVYQAITIFWSENPASGKSQIVGLVEVFLVTTLMLNETYTKKSRILAEKAFLISGLVYFAFALFFTVDQIYTGRKIITFGTYGSVDPNEWCAYLIVPIVVVTSRLYEDRSIYKKIFYIVYILLTLYLALMEGSRGGLLAILVTLLFVICKRTQLRTQTIFGGLFLLVTLFFVTYNFILPKIPASVLSRFTVQGITAYGGAGGRGELWKEIIVFLNDHIGRLIAGNGLYGAKSVPYVTHNQYLQILLDTGIIGLVLYIVLLIRIYKNAKNKGLLETASFIGIQVALLSLTAYSWFKAVYVIYLLCMMRYEEEPDEQYGEIV